MRWISKAEMWRMSTKGQNITIKLMNISLALTPANNNVKFCILMRNNNK